MCIWALSTDSFYTRLMLLFLHVVFVLRWISHSNAESSHAPQRNVDWAAAELTGRPGAAQKLLSRGGLGNGWCVISVTPDPLCSGSQLLS